MIDGIPNRLIESVEYPFKKKSMIIDLYQTGPSSLPKGQFWAEGGFLKPPRITSI